MIGPIVLSAFEYLFLLYVVAGNLVYLAINLVAYLALVRSRSHRSIDALPKRLSGLEPPISILAPAYNEEATIATAVRSLLQLSYTGYEVIVVNDGSSDRTLNVLIEEFELTPIPDVYHPSLPTKPIKAVYGSPRYPALRIVDKENGGKADALNAGINLSRCPLFCCVDADSILDRDGLLRIVQPFLDDPRTVACGGTIRIANGCDFRGGFVATIGLPKNWLALIQTVEYLRAFLFGRMGWSPLNAMLIISGAFGLFHRETVIQAGGYRVQTIGEDMELVVRLHRHLLSKRLPYRIAYVPDPICWTEAPENLDALRLQRIRWQRGLCESLAGNRQLLFQHHGGAVAWLAFPFMAIWEWLGPLFDFAGYTFIFICALFGFVSFHVAVAFAALGLALGVFLSVSALLLEELTFHAYPKMRHVTLQFAIAIAENFGYRQLTNWWRLVGFVQWFRGTQASWGSRARLEAWKAQ